MEWISTAEMAEELRMCTKTLQKLRAEGCLLPGSEFMRGHGSRSPILWNKDAVIQALRCRTARLES